MSTDQNCFETAKTMLKHQRLWLLQVTFEFCLSLTHPITSPNFHNHHYTQSGQIITICSSELINEDVTKFLRCQLMSHSP